MRYSIIPVLLASILAFGGAISADADETHPLELTIRNKNFEPASLRAPAGKALSLKIKNLDATPEEFESSALRVEKIVAGNGEITVKIKALTPGIYEFHGEYNPDTAKGVLVAE